MLRYRLMKCVFRCLAFSLSLTAFGAAAAASTITPKTDGGTYVSAIQINPDGKYTDVSRANGDQLAGQIAYMNRDTCVNFFDNNSVVSFNFNLTSNGSTFFQTGPGAYFFVVSANADVQDFKCDTDSQDDCVAVEGGDLPQFTPTTNSTYAYSQQIQFDQLVNEAASNASVSNGNVELIVNADDCRQKEVDQRYFFRMLFEDTQTGNGATGIYDEVIELDTTPPPAPTAVTSVVVTESKVYVNWEQDAFDDMVLSVDANATRLTNPASPWAVFYADHDITGMTLQQLKDAVDAGDVYKNTLTRDNLNDKESPFSGQATLDGLDNLTSDSRVWIAVVSRDGVGNLSEPVYPDITGAADGFQVLPVVDFWEHYKDDGGAETGCNQAAGGPIGASGLLLALLGLGGLMWRRRRDLGRLGPLMVAVLAFGATSAVSSMAHAESSTWGIVELRLGGYYPSIDQEPGLSGQPFHDIFGGSNRVLFEYEQGVHLFDKFGALGLSGTVGYTNFGGNVIAPSSVENTAAANESTNFKVFPLAASAYYRFDLLQKWWHIPLVPTAELGVDWVLWRVTTPSGDTASYQGDQGHGGTWGWHFTGGLALQLDWIEPQNAAALDRSWGINNTYAFAEWEHLKADDFGSSTSFVLDDDMWMFGLAFEY